MPQNHLAQPATLPTRLRRDRRYVPCVVENNDEYYANGIFEFNITKLLLFLDAKPLEYPVEVIPVASLPAYGEERLVESTICNANLRQPVLLAEISPGRFNLIDGHHRIARARREGVLDVPMRRVGCRGHLAFMTSVRAYHSYVEYWNGKIDDLQPLRRRLSAVV